MNAILIKTLGAIIAAAVFLSTVWAYRSTDAVQRGYPGVAMEQIEMKSELDARAAANKVPTSLPPANQDGQLAIDAYKNVQVLGHITSGEMTRLMTAMTLWVAPKQGCAYCHAHKVDDNGVELKDEDGYPLADFAKMDSDELYAKRVARRMLQMTMHINSNYQTHVAQTGVTCYTCHRGLPVPAQLWWDAAPDQASPFTADTASQNKPAYVAGLTSLPSDAMRTFLVDPNSEGIRVISTEPLPIDNRASIKQTEWTYGLMMHMSTSLGVNCTYCHNTRSMAEWKLSPPARKTAWYGIRMARDINTNYLEPLLGTLPPERLGPTGDVPKLNCATCHQGVYKPLLGVSMLKDYQVLAKAVPQPEKTPPPPPAEPPADAPPTGGSP